jgi:hypothetical protein
VHGLCVGKPSCFLLPRCISGHCTLGPSEASFPDPCHMTVKHLDAAVKCGVMMRDGGGDGADSSSARSAVLDPPPAGLLPSVWKATDSYVKRDDPWVGTELDWSAHAASLGWDSPAGSKVVASWSTAAKTWPLLAEALPLPRANMLPPTAVIRTLKPTKVDSLGNGTFVYSFPENFVGVLSVGASHIRLKHGGEGGSVSFQHSEVLANGTAGKRQIEAAWAFKGQKETHSFGADWAPASPAATLTPLFVWHGGQFVQVTVSGDVSFDASLTAVTALVTHANLTQTGHITFSGGDEEQGPSATLNGLNQIILNSQVSNVAAGTPTDCPTCADLLVGPLCLIKSVVRGCWRTASVWSETVFECSHLALRRNHCPCDRREKHGWLGDAQVTAEEALYNFDMASVCE